MGKKKQTNIYNTHKSGFYYPFLLIQRERRDPTLNLRSSLSVGFHFYKLSMEIHHQPTAALQDGWSREKGREWERERESERMGE